MLFWILSIIIRKDLFSPESMLCLSYIFAIICAIYNIDNWKINLHQNTFYVVTFGIFSFWVISLMFYLLQKKKGTSDISKTLMYINVKKSKLLFLNSIAILISIIYTIYFIKAIGGAGALTNFSNAMEIYRNKTMFHHLTLIPSWINFMSKYCRALCYIYIYILINNALVNKSIDNKIVLQNRL